MSDYRSSSDYKPSRKGPIAIVIAGLVFVTVVFALIFARPSTISTGPDQTGLHYSGGAFTATRFENCVAPSTRNWDGPGDKHYSYPTSQSNFVFGQGGDGAPLTFVTKDGIEMSVTGVANFVLASECQTLRQFHDLIGNRYAAYMVDGERSDGWSNKVLPIYIGRPLDTAVDRAGQAYTYTELYSNPAVKAQWEADVLEALPELVNRQTDGEVAFFENFAITLQKPEPPQSIKDALVAQQEQVAQANARKAEAEAQRAAAEAQIAVERANAAQIAALIKVLGIEGYLQRYAIDNGQNPFQPSTQGLITQ